MEVPLVIGTKVIPSTFFFIGGVIKVIQSFWTIKLLPTLFSIYGKKQKKNADKLYNFIVTKTLFVNMK